MNTELINTSDTKKRLLVEISPDEVRNVYDKVTRNYANGAQVPGFRKGMAPLDIIRMRFKDEIQKDVFQEMVPKFVTEAIQEHSLTPIAEPSIQLDDIEKSKVNGSQPINLVVDLEVMPEIPEPKYEGFEVTRRVMPIKDEELDSIIDEQRQRESTYVPIEGRASEDGDTVIVDLKGIFLDDPNGDPIEVSDLDIKLGDEVVEKSFSDNLIGVKPEEQKEFSVEYPEDFSSTALAGRHVKYTANVKSIGSVELPELNDDWVESLEEDVNTVSELREKLRKDMGASAKADAEARVRNELVAKLIEANDFEVPSALIENQAKNLLNNFAQDLSNRGVDLSKVDQSFVESSYNEMRSQAERDVKGAMLLEKIAEMEKVEVTDEMLANELQTVSEQYGMPVDEVKNVLESEGNLEAFKGNLLTREAVEALVSKALITDGDWIAPVEDAAPESDPEKEEKENKKEKVKKKAADAKGASKKPEKKEKADKTAKEKP